MRSVLLFALLVAGCASDAPRTADEGADDVALAMEGVAYVPDRVVAAPGATVAVENRDAVAHTVTATGGAFDTGNVDAGATATFVAPEAPGEYAFVCAWHPEMRGTLVVA